MSAASNREKVLRSFLIGEQVQASRSGVTWDEAQARAKFGRLIAAEQFEALGVDQESVDVGARVLMRGTRTGWDGATIEQRLPWQKAIHAVLSAVRDFKTSTPPTSGKHLPIPKRAEAPPRPAPEPAPAPESESEALPKRRTPERKRQSTPQTKPRQHGTRAKYVKERCPCEKCRKADRVYKNELRARKQKGENPLVSAERSRSLLKAVIAKQGTNMESIAHEMGYSPSSVNDIFNGRSQSVRVTTEKKIIEMAHQAGVEQGIA